MYTAILYDATTVIQFIFAAFILGYGLSTIWILWILKVTGHGF